MTSIIRPSGRALDQLRDITFETNVTRYAEGSCIAKFGNTHVLCTASWTDKVPGWMRGTNKGWVTGEYGMLPRATHSRNRREATAGKQSGRTQEIQRLIGRSLRSVVDLEALGENQITVDCDVLQADGGTRTASITGGYIALALAMRFLKDEGVIKNDPITKQAAAISVGLWKDQPVLDVDYPEDSEAGVDGNFVMTGGAILIEVQMSAEGSTYSRDQMNQLMDLAEKGVSELVAAQSAAVA